MTTLLTDTQPGQRYSVVVRPLLRSLHTWKEWLTDVLVYSYSPTRQLAVIVRVFVNFPIENVSNPISTHTGIRAVPNLGTQGFAGGTNLAILRYAGAPVRDPTPDPTINIPQSRLPLKETDLHVRVPHDCPTNATDRLRV
jgi:hypothetical protein